MQHSHQPALTQSHAEEGRQQLRAVQDHHQKMQKRSITNSLIHYSLLLRVLSTSLPWFPSINTHKERKKEDRLVLLFPSASALLVFFSAGNQLVKANIRRNGNLG
jgi:hypothetical protein